MQGEICGITEIKNNIDILHLYTATYKMLRAIQRAPRSELSCQAEALRLRPLLRLSAGTAGFGANEMMMHEHDEWTCAGRTMQEGVVRKVVS